MTTTICAILINREHEVLLERRGEGWSLPCGTLEAGEQPENAMLRALLEHLRIDVPIAYWMSFGQQHVYVGGLETPIHGQQIESFTREEIAELTLSSDQRQVLEQFFGGVRVAIVSAILLDQNGRVLMQHRADTPNISYPNMWSLWGGRVDVGETPLDALQRELREEIGREAETLQLWRTNQLPYNAYITTDQHVFVGTVDWRIEDITVMEGQGAAYLSPDEIAALPVALNFGKIIKTYFSEKSAS